MDFFCALPGIICTYVVSVTRIYTDPEPYLQYGFHNKIPIAWGGVGVTLFYHYWWIEETLASAKVSFPVMWSVCVVAWFF